MKVKDGMKVTGTVEGILRGPDGRIKERFKQSNLIVDEGFENIINFLTNTVAGIGFNDLTHLGIGWAEPDQTPAGPAAGDVNIPTGGNYKTDRVASVVTKIDTKNCKLVSTWGAAEPASAGAFPVAVRSIGAFWAAGAGDNELFAWILRAVINKASADSLEITYTFTLS